MQNTPEYIKLKISELAEKHRSTGDELDDFTLAELLEMEAEQLIVAYCEENGYLINGFPTEKKALPEEELDDDYFCRERYLLYLDILTTQKEDVADLTWHYVSSFWEDQFDSKEVYIEILNHNLGLDNYYDVSL